jgi:hypothetical protein
MSEPEKPDPMDGLKREPIRIGVQNLQTEKSRRHQEGTEGGELLAQGDSTAG